MRLLNVHDLCFKVFYRDIPEYVTASHRWAQDQDDEATIRDVQERNTHKIGYRKVEGFAKYVEQHIPHVNYVWIDTCCINNDSSQEVQEAINSMFGWYSHAAVCLAYLEDVIAPNDIHAFRQSKWFSRGWTLQELLAPRLVVFLTRDWQVIGYKGGNRLSRSGTELHIGPSLEVTIAATTGIEEAALRDHNKSQEYSPEQKLAWMDGRETTRPEDTSYCLLGLFNISMSTIYGEGKVKARIRLLREIHDSAILTEDQAVASTINVMLKHENVNLQRMGGHKPKDAYDVPVNMNHLNTSYNNLNKLSEKREPGLELENTSTFDIINDYGVRYENEGKLGQAEEMYMRALKGKEHALGPEHTSTLDTVHNLGRVYARQGNLRQAEEMNMRALHGREETLGWEHTSTLETVNNLGSLYQNQGKLRQAEEMHMRGLRGKERVLGPKHTSTLVTAWGLGIVYRRQGKLKQAEEMYMRALQGFEKAEGSHEAQLTALRQQIALLQRRKRLPRLDSD